LRILERTIVTGGAMDAESLCVQSGLWVWKLSVQITVLDHGGNLVDASVLAAVASLRHFRIPNVDTSSPTSPVVVHSDNVESSPLPLHHTPLASTLALFSSCDSQDDTVSKQHVSTFIDPTHIEEHVVDGTLTVCSNKYGELCCLDFPGGCEVLPETLKTCVQLTTQRCIQYCDMLEQSLENADTKAKEDRLTQLKQVTDSTTKKNTVMVESDAIPMDDIPEGKKTQKELLAAQIAAAEDESYRIQALDYKGGHVAARVKEDNTNERSAGKPIVSGSLMAAMLKSANNGDTTSDSRNQSMDIDEKQLSTTTDTTETKVTKEELTATTAKALQPKSTEKATRTSHQQPNDSIMTGVLDSDEEEVTTTLQSEFAFATDTNVSTATSTEESPNMPATVPSNSVTNDTPVKQNDNEDNDFDDLAMAVKKKSKKGKKSKRKK